MILNFCKSLRGWRGSNGESGLTLGGLLMFGNRGDSGCAAALFGIGLSERPEAKTELRWVDRLYPDGSWGQSFEFFGGCIGN